MLGNDVVDLHDQDSWPETYRPGFDERVFSPDERWAIAHDLDPLARRWAHWGAKEAAYKLVRQIDSTFVFSPGRLVACYASVASGAGGRIERRGNLSINRPDTAGGFSELRIELRSFETSERIHVIAVPAGTDWGAVDSSVERLEIDQKDASAAVRRMAVAEIGRRLGVDLDRLSIGRRGRIPTVLLDGSETSLSLSLSHHGKWISYAMGLRVDSKRHSGWVNSGSPFASPVASRVQTA